MNDTRLKPAMLLVADRTLMGRYKVLFEGIFATMQTTQVPQVALRHFLSPKIRTDAQGRAHSTPLGLRRVESSLLCETELTADDVVCTTPEKVLSLIGPWTRAVIFSSSDPLGRGMSNTTTTNFWKGELYTKHWTRELLESLIPYKEKHGFKVVAGGAGAWQWHAFPELAEGLPVDVVFEGYFETQGPQFITDLLAGRPVESRIVEKGTCVNHIQPIRGASVLGILELSRGCGRGCGFCAMGRTAMDHLPVDTILADLQTNVSSGMTSVVSGSEDFFRYGATGIKPDFETLHHLLTELRRVKGLSFMQIDHGNVASVMQLEDAQLREIRRLLTWDRHTDYLWVNMGAESADGGLVAANSPGKITPFRAQDWLDLVLESGRRMIKTGFFPVFSVVLGLPGETPDHVTATLKMVREMGHMGAVVFPIFYEPILEAEIRADKRFTLDHLREDHLALYSQCYEINFRRVPALFWDNQRAGGVSWLKRATLQMLGKTEVVTWRRTFRRLQRQFDQNVDPSVVKEMANA